MGHDRDNAAGQRSAFATSRTDFWRAPKSTNDWRRQEADMTLDDILLKVLARALVLVFLFGVGACMRAAMPRSMNRAKPGRNRP